MKNIEFALRGEYNTSFFSFFVNTQERIFDENGKFNHNLNDKDKGTFIHEYVHYIQNIATTYGLMDITKTYSLLGYVVNQVHSHTDSTIELPINMHTSQITVENYFRFHLFKGNSEFKNLQSFNKLEPEYFEGDYQGIKQKCLRFNCLLDNVKVDSFVFGATCIKETMAHLVQCLIDPNTNNYPKHTDIPYKSAEIVANYFYPELIGEYKLNIVTLCYYSLSLPDSGNFFFEVLKTLKKLKYIPKNPIEFYDYLHNEFSNCVIIEPREDDTILWDKFWKEAQEQIEQYSGLKNAKDGHKTLKYLDEVFKSVKNIHEKLPSFFIASLSLLEKEQNNVIDEWLARYGLPHVFTENHEYFGEMGFMYLSPIHTVLYNLILPKTSSVFKFPNKRCNKHLFNRCSNALIDGKKQDITNSYCDDMPWERINQGCIKCPFTMLWENLGLNNKKEIIIK